MDNGKTICPHIERFGGIKNHLKVTRILIEYTSGLANQKFCKFQVYKISEKKTKYVPKNAW